MHNQSIVTQMKQTPSLLELNRQGIIPGPGETLDAYLKRADYCLHLHQEMPELAGYSTFQTDGCIYQARASLSRFADLSPAWTPLLFSNHKLAPWHAGCACIFQMTEDSPPAAFIQLRHSLSYSPRYLRFYDRQELLKHELVHVSRMAFQEPKYEEFLAYQTSESTFRRWFGPLIQSPFESVALVLLLVFILLFDLFLISMHQHEAYLTAAWLKCLPLALLAVGLGRLWARHRKFKNCLKNLRGTLQDEWKALSTLYRLTDKEICAFARMAPQQILDYAEGEKEQELRWQVVYEAYFKGASA
jgi:hypothetical protein